MAKNDVANATQTSLQTAVPESVAAPSGAVSVPDSAPAPAPAATHHLIVIHPFGNYAKGARIEDANDIAAVLAGENAGSCNRIQTGA